MRADVPALGVDRDDDGLRAEPVGELRDQLRPRQRSRVDADLVRARLEQLLGIGGTAHAAPDRERDREPLCDAPHHLDERRALVERRGDVEEDELVGTVVGVRRAELDRVADVAQLLEAHALHDAPARHVEAGDQTRERHSSSNQRAPSSPLFSGWNWQPTNEPWRASATIPSDQAVAAGVTAA